MHRVEKKIIAELLAMYKKLPCLWDVTDQFYSNKVARNRAYATLVEKYKEIDSECNQQMLKQKIGNLRSTYRRERKKVVQSKFHGGEIYKPNLWYYPLFTFLEQLEPNSDEDSMYNDSPEPTQAVPEKMVATEGIPQNERLLQMAPSNAEITNCENSEDMQELANNVPETLRATESIMFPNEEEIGLEMVEPQSELEIEYQTVKRPKPRAVYITETECDYESESPTARTRTTKRRKKNKSKIDPTSIVIEDDDDDEPISCKNKSGQSSGFRENDLFAKTMSAQLSELRPKQRYIAQKLMSEVIFFGRLDKLRTDTKLQLNGE